MKTISEQLDNLHRALKTQYEQNISISELLKQRSAGIDEILTKLWQEQWLDKQPLCLIGTGGYGRQELHPFSDIDIFIIAHTQDILDNNALLLEQWIRSGWDLGLRIAQNITSLAQLSLLSRENIATATSLLDARLITGNEIIFQQCLQQANPHYTWNSQAFYKAKRLEQKKRHEKYGNTGYNLEPNIKEGPGGLRDIQTIFWIAKQHFYIDDTKQLVEKNFLTQAEYDTLMTNKHYLETMRTRLHYIANRKEERLLFDYQVALAKNIYPKNQDKQKSIETLMKKYFRVISEINEINDMLLQLFRENILTKQYDLPYTTHENDFIIQNNCIGVASSQLFDQRPAALLEIFLILAKSEQIKNINAATLRLIRQKRHLITEEFCQQRKHQELFLDIVRQPCNIAKILRTMNRYGILGRYLPHFGEIVGQMQYDLFHMYTVDRHLIKTVNFLYIFSTEEAQEKFPLCHEIILSLPKKDLLYLAGLFHDMGKGRGADHSELGSQFVQEFCQQHQISSTDSELIAWLVENHLIISFTAQKCDFQNPEVIADFARKIKNTTYLDYLYVLTCADICATNEKLWNHWRDALLKKLYQMTKLYLQQNVKHQKASQKIAYNRRQAMRLLTKQNIADEMIEPIWHDWSDNHFLHHTPKTIARHTLEVFNNKNLPIVAYNTYNKNYGTEFFIYCHQNRYAFANITALFDRCHLNILQAQISVTKKGYHLGSYIVADMNGKPLHEEWVLLTLQKQMLQLLQTPLNLPKIAQRHTSKRLRHFRQYIQIEFRQNNNDQYTIIEISTVDYPGLLARIGLAFAKHHIIIHQAKIVTLDQKVEDVFFVTDEQFNPIVDKPLQDELTQSIREYLLN